MKIREITDCIESFAPLAWQEEYDNAGLIVGRPDDEVHAALLAVDVTEAVLDEAEARGCDLIITHHPLVFRPMKRFNSADYVQRCVERAIRRGIALYACHTNLDSAPGGMSWQLAAELGIGALQPLQCTRPETQTGFGVVGTLPEPMPVADFLRRVQQRLGVRCVRHTPLIRPQVQRVALCTGAGASLMTEARRSGADLYLTADLKYNDFLQEAGEFMVADIGHFESEYCAINLLFGILSKNLLNFALHKSENSLNPVNYLVEK